MQPGDYGNRGIRQVNGRGVDEIPNLRLTEIAESCCQVHQAISETVQHSGTWRSLAAVPLQRKIEPAR